MYHIISSLIMRLVPIHIHNQGYTQKTPQEKINTKQILKLTEETISKNYIMADCCIPFRVTTYWDTSTSKTVLSSTSANAPFAHPP